MAYLTLRQRAVSTSLMSQFVLCSADMLCMNNWNAFCLTVYYPVILYHLLRAEKYCPWRPASPPKGFFWSCGDLPGPLYQAAQKGQRFKASRAVGSQQTHPPGARCCPVLARFLLLATRRGFPSSFSLSPSVSLSLSGAVLPGITSKSAIRSSSLGQLRGNLNLDSRARGQDQKRKVYFRCCEALDTCSGAAR